MYCASLVSAAATAQAIGAERPTYIISGSSSERAAFDDGDDDLAVSEHIESLRATGSSEVQVSERILASKAATRLRLDGIDEADIRLSAAHLHGPTLVASLADGVISLEPVPPN